MTKYSKQQLAESGETLAAKLLCENGYCLIDRNYRCRSGEIDIIVERDQLLVFVEVKTRSHPSLQAALDNVSYRKQVNLTKAANDFLNQNQQYRDYNTRFDIVVVIYSAKEDSFTAHHYQDAFLPIQL